MATTVFLSHAGADTAAADVFRKRLEMAGFDVWFDKRDLRAGHMAWQKQIEDKIEQVDAFVVYVGSRGVVNWVEAETRYALSRVVSGKPKLAFVPVLSRDVKGGSKSLPGFARQFQAIRDVENDPNAWNQLVDGLKDGVPPPAEKKPFFSLDPITADCSHLFFGRRNEIGRIVDRLTDRNLLLVVGDSGAGKSSLVRAGLIPAWRGNEVGVRRGEHPGERDWLTITMTPGDDPWKSLREGVQRAAVEERGLDVSEAAKFVGLAGNDDPVIRESALRLNADPSQARVLLVVDQLEELFVRKTISAETRRSFAAFLAELANPTDPSFAVVLTMRADYSNYLNEPDVAPMKERIDAKEARARYPLRSILLTDPDGDALKKTGADRLREVVTGPLALARVPEDKANALADLVLRDTGGAPSDLALVQFALSETWEASGGKEAPDPSKLNLLGAYVAVGRVEGALAKAADRAVNDLIQRDIATEEDVWAALFRLGSLEGASPLRRTAQRAEFTESRWAAIQYLASQDGGRIVHISGEGDQATAEIAHEALLTQWGRLNQLLAHNSEDKRLLDGFVLRAREAEEGQKLQHRRGRLRALLRAAALQSPDPDGAVLFADDAKRFERLAIDHRDWLTEPEAELLQRSSNHAFAVRSREALRPKVMGSSLIVLAALLASTAYLWLSSVAQQRLAALNEAAALAALSEVEIQRGEVRRAAILALAAVNSGPDFPPSIRVMSAFDRANGALSPDPIAGVAGTVWSLDFAPDGGSLVAGDEGGKVSLIGLGGNQAIIEKIGHEGDVYVVSFSPDGTVILSGGADGALRVWRAADLAFVDEYALPETEWIRSATFSPDGTRIAIGIGDGTLQILDAATLDTITEREPAHSDWIMSLEFSPDGRRLASGGADGQVRLSDGYSLIELWQRPTEPGNWINGLSWSPNGEKIATGSDDGFVRIWNSADGTLFTEPWLGHFSFGEVTGVASIAFSPDGTAIASGGRDDGSIRFWPLETSPLSGAVFQGSQEFIMSLEFSSDGSLIASGDNLGEIRLWRSDRYLGSERIKLLCSTLAPIDIPEMEAIKKETGITILDVCAKETLSKTLNPIWLPETSFFPQLK